MSGIKTRIKGAVEFSYYQDGNLWYKCQDGFLFPVPISDCGSAIFSAVDKGMFFMRWIKKHMDLIEKGAP
jgi:hypothetical protein